ncbi:sulfur carrier protein ThiS [bacterium]|nr:sulfur carrier protein ThiS [candidate division CSSED10-310 bacterium]
MITVNNRDELSWHDGMTVQDILDVMGYTYVLIMVTVNGVLVHSEDYSGTKVPDEADVRVIHIMHGG